LLGDDVERHGRKARMQRPHHPRQHGAVADAGIEHAQRRRRWLEVRKLERDAVGDLGLLAAGRDEQEIFLPIVEEAEARRRDARRSCAGGGRRRRGGGTIAVGLCRPMFAQVGADLVERAGRDLGAVAKPRDQFAVVDNEPPESRFCGSGRATKFPDLAEDLFRGPAGRTRWTLLAFSSTFLLTFFLARLLFDPHGFALVAGSPLCGFWGWAVGSVNHKPSGQSLWAHAHIGSSPCKSPW